MWDESFRPSFDYFWRVLRYKLDLRKAILRVVWSEPRPNMAEYGKLLMLVVEPLEGFVHFVKEEYLEELYEAVGPYHISIAFEADIERIRRRKGDSYVYDLLEDVYKYDGSTGALFHNDVDPEGNVLVTRFFKRSGVKKLQSRGYYRYKKLHIAM